MRKLRWALVALTLGSSSLVLSATPAAADDTCGLPKAACLVYYKACAVAAEAGLQCVD